VKKRAIEKTTHTLRSSSLVARLFLTRQAQRNG
jgi:hypothetical protein